MIQLPPEVAESSEAEHPTAVHNLQFHRASFPHTIKTNVAVSVKWEGRRQSVFHTGYSPFPKLVHISNAQETNLSLVLLHSGY